MKIEKEAFGRHLTSQEMKCPREKKGGKNPELNMQPGLKPRKQNIKGEAGDQVETQSFIGNYNNKAGMWCYSKPQMFLHHCTEGGK